MRFLNSSVLVWPNQRQVDEAARAWATKEARKHPELNRLGYFGSYARGDWGVGSDLDLVAVVEDSSEPFERRALSWDLHPLPVPADLLVYTELEWDRMEREARAFFRRLAGELSWIYPHRP
ncbi:MAG: nucleotidyltransferase domain-containing protein [Acidobacteriota bacterium]